MVIAGSTPNVSGGEELVEEPAETDYAVIVVDAGAGGISEALNAAIRGLPAGAIWIPNSSPLHRVGCGDNFDRVRDHLAATVGDGVPDTPREVYPAGKCAAESGPVTT
ncbi:hypothetical protein [Nocardia rhamnosiphila]|uniref:Uncharacterized protein n=1 Tax=Nocardia rhamnosiphila TaxID=426716 RepID=A0ABV2X0L7_9NOCA